MTARRRTLAGLAAGAAAIALLTAALAAAAPRTGEAQTAAPPVTRVVFAIDNSVSMFGDGIAPAADPGLQRIEGVRRLLAVLRGFLGAADERRTVEIGALSFGSAGPDRPAVEVLFPPSAALDPELAHRLRAEPRGGTDFAAALCGAWAMASGRAPAPPAGCELPAGFLGEAGAGRTPPAADEQRLVVLITDGSPAPDGPEELSLDGDPKASDPACADAAGFATGDGDEYLCSLAATWAALRAQRHADLIVIGLDEGDLWFDDAEAYWRRAIGCGEFGPRGCDGLVVRSVNPDELAALILGAFPTVDLCEAVEDEPYTCDVPGGLASVGFQINGVTEDTDTAVANEAGDRWRSADRPPQFSAPVPDSHVWRFARPDDGRWTLTSDGPRSQLVLVDYDPALFGIEPLRWDATGLELALTAHEPVHVRSAEDQAYWAELRRGGAHADGETVHLTHEGGRVRFALTAPGLERPAGGETGGYAVVLHLRTPRKDIEVGWAPLDAFLADTGPAATPTPAPAPAPAPAPSCADLAVSWDGEPGEARRWQWGLRFGWPLLRFREAAPQRVTIDGDCGEPIAAEAYVIGCAACAATATGPPPLGLTVPASGLPGGDAERRAVWRAPSSGAAGETIETVRVSGPALLEWEPWWGWALHLLAALLLLAAVSAASVRADKGWSRNEDEAPPVRLAVPDAKRQLVGIVRWGVFAWRRVPGDEAERTLTLRWLVAGPLVARGGSGRALWLGDPAGETGIDIRRRPRREDAGG